MSRFGTVAGAALVVLATTGALAGELSPGLADLMEDLSDQDVIKVLVILADQPDIANLDKDLHARQASRAERHQAVVGSLQATAKASQEILVRDLAMDKAAGGIVGFTPHWIVNSVVVKGTVAAIRELAARPDVAVVEADMVAELIHPVMVKEAAPSPDKGIADFVAPGLQIVGADRVWHELGIYGTGTLVANMDSGVDGSHPALNARWRGNFTTPGAAWNDIGNVGFPDFPGDLIGHGTHVMGTITGATASDTVGVAPGAQWIANNAVHSTSEDFDNNIIAGFEWIADPDGDPATTDDVPDVCHNSWGVNPSAGYPSCDSTWWDVIDNCEAAGVVVTWSAGNEGPAPSTLRSPPDRADTPTSSFSVGSIMSSVPYTVSDFSSRGPSLCGGPYEIKPEVVAPGENIVSSIPGGGYGYMDGTSMAGPHVAGVVALMREAAPNLDVTTIKEVLMATAIDMGDPGEDNAYGHGLIDAYAAVSMVMNNVGEVTGTMTDAVTTLPLEGVTVQDLRGNSRTTTDVDGHYSYVILGGATSLSYNIFGYDEQIHEVVIPAGGTLDLSVALDAQTPAVVSGTVRGPGGSPIVGATITALATPVAQGVSDAAGFYSLTLPSSTAAAYDLLVMAPNLAYDLRHIGLQSSRTEDFDLPDIVKDGFESGGFATLSWERSGNLPWTVSGDQAHEGVLSARSGTITHSQSSELALDYFVQGDGEFSFWYKVDSEPAYDRLFFYLNGELQETWSGAVDWTLYSMDLPTGAYEFRWVYSKDSSASAGADAAWIDLVELPGTGVQPLAAITLDATHLDQTLAAGTTATVPLQIGNTGQFRLHYRVTPTTAGGPPTWLSVTPDTSSVHPGSVRSIDIHFDAGPAPTGTHAAELLIASNDPAHPDTAVTINFTVTAVSATNPGSVQVFGLRGGVPNPFNPATDIQFSLARAGRADLRIYDVSGRLVRTLVNQHLAAGPHNERWNGQDNHGRDVASGVYFARLQAVGETSIKPLTLVR